MVASVLDFFTSFYSTTGPNPTITGADLTQLVNELFKYQTGITAYQTGGVTSAQAITAAIAEFTTSATATSSAALPSALPGRQVIVINDASNSIQLFGQFSNPNNSNTTDTITPSTSSTAAAAGTGISIAAGSVSQFVSFKLGQWKQIRTS